MEFTITFAGQDDVAGSGGMDGSLIADLRELGVPFDIRTQPAPAYAKGDGSVVQIIVALAASPVLVELVKTLQIWVSAKASRVVELTGRNGSIKLVGSPGKRDRELVETWIQANQRETAE